MPRSVQIRQRGWRYDSDMPQRYAGLVAGDVDRYYKQSLGVEGGEDTDERPVPCPRCRQINLPDAVFCKRRGLPITEEGVNNRDTVTQPAMQVLKVLTFPADPLGEEANTN